MTIHFDVDPQLSKKVMWTESWSTYNYPLFSRLLVLFFYFCFTFSLASFLFFPIFIDFLFWQAALALSFLAAGLLCVSYRLFTLHRRMKKQMKIPVFQPGQKQSLTLTDQFLLHSYANGKFYTKHPYSSVTAVFERKEWIIIYFGKSFVYFPLSVFRTSEERQSFWKLLDPKQLDSAGKLDVFSEMQNYPNASFPFCFAWMQQEFVDAVMDIQELSYSKFALIAALQKHSVFAATIAVVVLSSAARFFFPNINLAFLYVSIFMLLYIFKRTFSSRPRSTREQLNAQIHNSLAPLGYLDPQCILLDGSCIILILTGVLCCYPLSQIQKIDNTSRAIALSLGIYGNIFIPARVFESPEQKQAFLKTLESYLPAH